MEEGIKFVIRFINRTILGLNQYGFELFGFTVGLFDLIFSFIALSMIISLFWKGGRG